MADIPRLCDLLAILFTQEVDFSPDREKQAKGLAQIISDPAQGFILVSCHENTPVGMVNLLFSVSTARGGKVGLLEDMVVRPEFRRSGWGSQLLLEAQRQARQAGCLRLTLLTDADNHSAHLFYERHGFLRSTMQVMRQNLE